MIIDKNSKSHVHFLNGGYKYIFCMPCLGYGEFCVSDSGSRSSNNISCVVTQ